MEDSFSEAKSLWSRI